ncbi:hypothetical protein FOCC_FOCC014022 [Frankliniella occidentalis]|nr:hypothetical protein FOCC_FOCC014022 [Frankliniella occidentalis]
MSKRGPGDLPRSTQYRLKTRAYESANLNQHDISSNSSESEDDAEANQHDDNGSGNDSDANTVSEENNENGDPDENNDVDMEENSNDDASVAESIDDQADTDENDAENESNRGGSEAEASDGQEIENEDEQDNNPEQDEEADNFLQQADVNADSSEQSDSDTDSEPSSSGSSTEDTSESDGDDDEEEQERLDGDVPLYENARLSVIESVILILTLALRFSLTELAGKDSVCENCQENTEVAFFIEIPIIRQLQRLFLRPGFVEKLLFRFQRVKKHEDNIEDIYDGNLYKEQTANNGILSGRHNISLTWYSDGIQIFKSVKYAVWPLFFVINELSYKERTLKENIILSGLWFGKSKPKPNLFLRPFRATFETFKNQGFNFNVPAGPQINVKGILICGTCDLQAKGIFLRTKLYNGFYGCNRCRSAGVRVPAGRTTVHAHPYVPPENIEHRNIGEVLNSVRIAHQTGNAHLGYKGLSLLYYMMVNMLRGCSIDIMHLVFLGTCKLLTKLWFDVKFAAEPYSCYRLIATVNARLLKICPPSFVQRMTRTLEELKLWKAKDYKLWFFYYSLAVLDGILDNVYLVHHMKLVSAISLLCQESISPDQLDRAEVMLHEYVRQFERLYTMRFMGMNVHLLLHLVDVVRDLGPLWVYSCFFFEDLNGQLVKLIHSPHQPGLQICSSASMFMSFKLQVEKLHPDSLAKRFCLKIQESTCKLKTIEEINAKMFVVGHNTVRLNVPNHIIDLIMNQQQGIIGGHFQSFAKLRKSGVVFCCANRPTRKKRCSHFACFNVDNVPILVPSDRELVLNCDQILSVCFYIELDNAMYLGTPVNRLEYE